MPVAADSEEAPQPQGGSRPLKRVPTAYHEKASSQIKVAPTDSCQCHHIMGRISDVLETIRSLTADAQRLLEEQNYSATEFWAVEELCSSGKGEGSVGGCDHHVMMIDSIKLEDSAENGGAIRLPLPETGITTAT